MKVNKMPKEELELLSNKEITKLILEERKRPLSTADLFNRIIDLLDLPKKTFEEKIADYYTSLATDKNFILLDNGMWGLRNRYKSDKIVKIEDEEENDETDFVEEVEETEDIEEDNYDEKQDDYDDAKEDLKDLVIIDESELEE